MTTIALASILCRRLRVPDLASAPAGQKREILLAINSALQRIYARMPAAHKRTTISVTLGAPETIAVEFTERFTNMLVEPAFDETHIGCTALVIDDPDGNEITGANSLLDDYHGTTLSGNALVYHNAVPLYEVIERLGSHPILSHDGKTIAELTPDHEGFSRLDKAIGAPQRYSLIGVGSSQGPEPEFLLKVWPWPDTNYKLRFEAELSTARVTFLQITQTPVNLALNDRLCESVLIPIALGRLTASPDWAQRDAIPRIIEDERAALSELTLVPADVSPGGTAIGRPGGF